MVLTIRRLTAVIDTELFLIDKNVNRLTKWLGVGTIRS